MRRDIETALAAWQLNERRRPLLVRGARQVGKSFTLVEFGRRAFDEVVVVNFEQDPRYADCFTTLDPREITASLSVLTRKEIVPGKTLLFFDEIQECPRAITALRYFYEQMPQLHVVAAGSLLEFALASRDFRMPVGRVQYLYMGPLSFGEFLDALGEEQARQAIVQMRFDQPPTAAVHAHLLSLLKKYLILGGMPAVLAEFLASGDFERCQQVQTTILQTYRDDFGKYASRGKHRHLQKVFYAVPAMVANKFKYAHVDPDTGSRQLREALELLAQAGIVHRVRQTSGAGLPLEVGVKERHFKVVFLDVGLMQNICGLSAELALADDLMQINAGAVAEQFVGQELLANRPPEQAGALYYWAREARNSSAEIDYLLTSGTYIVPLEVKAGKTGTLRSLHLFLQEHGASWGVKTSAQPLVATPPVASVPLYALAQLPRFLDALKH